MVRTAKRSDGWLQALGALVWGLASTLLTLAVLLGLTAGVIMYVFGPTGEPARVPDVTGMEVAEAQARLESSGLHGVIGHESHDVEVPEGNVISTLPYAGKLVREGRDVQLVVSLGPREVKVPKVTGLTLNLAKEKLTAQDLTLGTVTTQSDQAEADTVLKQEPAPGALVGRNAEVKLVISGGPDYGTLETANGVKYLFRTLTLTVPEGQALQLVKVSVSGRQRDNSFYERLCGPGETVEVELYGRRGDRVQVTIEGKQVFSERL
jgi:beta-lactam-binding protein with PASTA domain